jgi:hypothetical protein
MHQTVIFQFDIRPHVGVLPVTFGMHRDDVHRVLGAPEISSPIWNKSGYSESYLRGGYNIGYDNEWQTNHVGFIPGKIELSIEGRTIWSPDKQPDPNPILLALDPSPVTTVGFWIYLQLGVTTAGYHDDNESQLAIAAFPLSQAEWFMKRATPADTSRYRPA